MISLRPFSLGFASLAPLSKLIKLKDWAGISIFKVSANMRLPLVVIYIQYSIWNREIISMCMCFGRQECVHPEHTAELQTIKLTLFQRTHPNLSPHGSATSLHHPFWVVNSKHRHTPADLQNYSSATRDKAKATLPTRGGDGFGLMLVCLPVHLAKLYLSLPLWVCWGVAVLPTHVADCPDGTKEWAMWWVKVFEEL